MKALFRSSLNRFFDIILSFMRMSQETGHSAECDELPGQGRQLLH